MLFRSKQAAGDLRHMVHVTVKDLGVDSALGANRRRPAQKRRIAEAVESAKRIARVPTGWQGRATLAAALSRSQFMWGADVTGLSAGALRRLRRWMAFAVNGGPSARRAPEVPLALAGPGIFLEPDLQVTCAIVRGWAKRRAQSPELIALVLPAWRSSCSPPRWRNTGGPLRSWRRP